MAFDFDRQLELRGTHCSKYDGIRRVFGTEDPGIIPMWVADMDYAAAPAIVDAVRTEVERGYFGYYTDTSPIDRAVSDWMARRHGWTVDPGAVRYTHGVIGGFGDVIDAYSDRGDAVIVFAPVYHAFYRQIRAMGREVLESPLRLVDGRFEMDLEGLPGLMKGNEKIVTLCSPHNPGGRIWSADELRAVAEFCAAHDLILIADEIHADLCFPGAGFTPIGVAAPEHLDRIIVLTAASKAFNIAGGETGLAIIPHAERRAEMDRVILDRESSPNRFGMVMMRAALTDGEEWLDAVRDYLAGNFRLLRDRLSALPGVSVMDMNATYLAWVDLRALGMPDDALLRRFINDARVAPSPGPQFGLNGSGFMRLNVALPRPTLLTALDRIEAAFSDIQ